MFFTPKQVNEQEALDSDSVPLQQRQELLLELDRTNGLLGVYRRMVKEFDGFLSRLDASGAMSARISVLEVGSGSGGLAREILTQSAYAARVDYYMMDMDKDVLQWAQSRLKAEGLNAGIYPSTDKHLAQFKDDQFDVIVSVHVLHHIHPITVLQDMFRQAVRVGRRGFLMVDFERRFGNDILTSLATLCWVSGKLSMDGIRSVRRAYTKEEILGILAPLDEGIRVSQHSCWFYQFIEGVKRT